MEVVDLRCLVPLDAAAVLASLGEDLATDHRRGEPVPGRLGRDVASPSSLTRGSDCSTRRCGGWPRQCVPLPFADALEDQVLPTVGQGRDVVRRLAAY